VVATAARAAKRHVSSRRFITSDSENPVASLGQLRPHQKLTKCHQHGYVIALSLLF
jgi:hypothetical protein